LPFGGGQEKILLKGKPARRPDVTGSLPMPRIIHRYLLREILHPFLVSLLAFTLIVFSGRLLIITRMILVKGIGLGEILRSCLYLLPYLLVFTLPMAATVGIILAFLRLSVDYEMMALKTAGLSYIRLMVPICWFSLAVALATGFLSLYGSPWGQRATRLQLAEVLRKRADLGLQEQTFNTDFQNLMLFVNRVSPKGGELSGIFVNDLRESAHPQNIYAQRGSLKYDPGQEALILRLEDGRLIRWGKDLRDRQTVEFKSYELPLPLIHLAVKSRQVSERELSPGELREALRQSVPDSPRAVRLVVELHQRLSLPLGALLLCFLAVPLGLSPQIHGRTWGLIVGLIIFIVYYIVFTASWRMAFSRHLHPVLAPYLADALCLVGTWYFWSRTLRELPLLQVNWFRRLLKPLATVTCLRKS
jgi:lipopolysaccharide export system permease protein